MQRFLAILGHWLHTLAFGAWFGSILGIGMLVAPYAFKVDRRFAAQVLEQTFRGLNTLSYVCAAIMLGATWAEWRVRGETARRLLFVRAVLTAAALAMGLYLGARLLPIMLGLRSAGQMAGFDRLHHVYEAVTEVQFWLLAAGALITAYVALPRKIRIRSDQLDPSNPSDASPQPPSTRTPEHRTPNTEPLNTGAQRP